MRVHRRIGTPHGCLVIPEGPRGYAGFRLNRDVQELGFAPRCATPAHIVILLRYIFPALDEGPPDYKASRPQGDVQIPALAPRGIVLAHRVILLPYASLALCRDLLDY